MNKKNNNLIINNKFVKIFSTLVCLLLPCLGFSLGLGNIEVKSYLSEPLKAVIPITDIGNSALGNIKIHLAPKEAYEDAGIDFPKNIPALTLTPQKNKKSQWVIVVTSKDPISQPILTFMLELSWPKGDVYRLYTLLLNPPLVETKSIPPLSQTTIQTEQFYLPRMKISRVTSQTVVLRSSPVGAAPNPQAVVSTTSYASKSIPLPQKHYYGPIKDGSNLYDIAIATLPSSAVTAEQNMVAIFLENPQAFANANMNNLITGQYLKLPSVNQIQAVTINSAAEIIKQQNAQWEMLQKGQAKKSSNMNSYSFLPTIEFNPSLIASAPSATTSPMQNQVPPTLSLKQSSVPNLEGQFTQNNGSSPKLALAITTLTQLEAQQKLLQMRLQDALSANQSLTQELGKRDRQLVSMAEGKVASDMPLKIISTNDNTPKVQQSSSAYSNDVSFSEVAQWLDWIIFIVFLILVIAILTLLLQLKRAQTLLISKEGHASIPSNVLEKSKSEVAVEVRIEPYFEKTDL